jgi:hypothetical protein
MIVKVTSASIRKLKTRGKENWNLNKLEFRFSNRFLHVPVSPDTHKDLLVTSGKPDKRTGACEISKCVEPQGHVQTEAGAAFLLVT